MQLFPLKLRLLCGCLLAGVTTAGAVDTIYVNSGAVTNPIVDAVAFLNEGYFQTSTSLPYETHNTLNYTNRGTMLGSIGYRFHTFTSNGVRKQGVSFHNEGSLEAVDNSIFFSVNGSTVFFGNSFNSFVMVNATNIVNEGSLTVGASGLLRLEGKDINLRGGALQAADSDFSDIGFFFTSLSSIFATNFFNETKVSDYYWGVGTNNVFGANGNPLDLQSGRFDPTSFSFGSGSHQVRNASDFTNTVSVPSFLTGLQGSGFRPFTYVTQVSPSNKIVQVVFVSTNSLDPDMGVDVRFSPNGNQDRGRHAVVQFSVNDTDAITGLPVTRSVYFGDNSFYATYGTNTMFYQDNIGTTTFRPNPYDITFFTPSQWISGVIQNSTFDPLLLYNSSYVNRFVTNAYAGYSAYIGNAIDTNLVADDFVLDPTNSLGRIEIFGGTLDLNLARMRSEGLLSIKSDNFLPVTTGAKLDAQQLNLNLTSTNQTFLISNILAGTVKRIAGRLNAYSCTWSNQTDTGDADQFHVLILENLLQSAQPSTAYGFIARVTNQPNSSIVLEDDATVARDFFLDAENITIGGSLVLPGSIGYANMPRVVNFTNYGTISVPSLTAFTLESAPYASFVNTNAVVAGAQAINATYFANNGLLQATVGSLAITNGSGTANLTNGFLMAATDIRLATGTLQASNSVVSAGSVTTNFSGQPIFTIGSLTFNVADGFEDGGSNTWRAFNGVHLYKSIPGSWVGDLLGTKVTSHARPFSLARHTWTAVDHGADRSGYTNNAAVGVLTLDAYNSARFRFSAPTAEEPSAIYIDYLELNHNATNYTTALEIDSNMKVYFANANVPPSKLDGAHDGRLRWVQNYAGPNTSTNIMLQDGRIITVNRALVESSEIDSDGDGTPNQFDTSPFDGPIVTTSIVNLPPLTTFLTWNGAANTTYTVDYTTNLVTWQVLTNVTTGNSAGAVTVSDPVSPDEPRFYRVRYSP